MVGPSEITAVVQYPDEHESEQQGANRLQRKEQLQEGALLVPRPFVFETHHSRFTEWAHCTVDVAVCVTVCVAVRVTVRAVCDRNRMWSR